MNLSRRELVSGLAVLGATALMPGRVSAAQAAAVDPARRRLIDVHHHIGPSFFQEAVKATAPEWSGWSPDKALADMDHSGIATAIVSYTQPGVWTGDAQQSARLARRCNEYAAQLSKDHPGRFGFFAALPLPDTDASLKEIDHALGTLKADGIGLMTSYDDKWLGDAAFARVFDELNRRHAVVYVHPTAAACCRSLMSYVPPNLTEFVQNTNRAITSLMYSGSLGRLRDIRFVFSHAGGTIPMLVGRMTEIGTRRPEVAAKIPNGVEYELRRLYYEVANSTTRPAMAALTSVVATSQMLFGSDYPFFPISVTRVVLRGSASPKRIGTRSNATMRSGCSLGSRPDEMRPSSQREKPEAGEQARLPRGRRPRGVTSAAALALLRGAGVPVADPPPLAFAPRLGEHTEAVLGAVGCDARRLADLRRRGIA